MNDLSHCFRSSDCLMFTDDVKLFKRIASLHDCLDFQLDLSSFAAWCTKWNMKLNLSKCSHINFSFKRTFNIVFDIDDNIIDSSRLTREADTGEIFIV